jgi:hypothetical protein
MNRDSLLATLDRLPPWQARILAMDGRKPISTPALAAKAGLSRATIKSLARANTWVGYELSTILKFTAACGIDLLKQKYPRQKLLRMMQSTRGPAHLSTSQRKYWNSIFAGERNWRAKP